VQRIRLDVRFVLPRPMCPQFKHLDKLVCPHLTSGGRQKKHAKSAESVKANVAAVGVSASTTGSAEDSHGLVDLLRKKFAELKSMLASSVSMSSAVAVPPMQYTTPCGPPQEVGQTQTWTWNNSGAVPNQQGGRLAGNCFTCGQPGHFSRNCPRRSSKFNNNRGNIQPPE